MQSSLARTVGRLAQTRSPSASAQILVEECCACAGATSGTLYLLDLGAGAFVPFAPEVGPSVDPTTVVPPADAIGERELFTPGPPGLAVYARRGATCLGALLLEGVRLRDLPVQTRTELTALSQLIIPIYEDRFTFTLLGRIQEPVDFSTPEREFFEKLGAITTSAAGMQYVALRELVDGRELRTLRLWGFDETLDQRLWDLRPVEDYPAFARAVNGETVTVATMSDPAAAGLRGRSEIGQIRSFVCTPVMVGTQTFGVLSFGAACEFEYTPIERRGFESIANGLGVTISNFRGSHELSSRIGEYKEAALAITAVEIAQAARHEALGTIGNCQEKLTRAYGRSKGQPTIAAELLSVSQELSLAAGALNKMRMATRPPARNLETVLVQDLFEQARSAVIGRVNELRVNAAAHGPAVTVEAYPDWLRQVFLNLIINSLDAFRDASSKRGRRIDLDVTRFDDRAHDVELVYRDNATGINPNALYVPDEYAGQPTAQQVFQPAVTSKRDGTGFGLWLVRRILDDHHGSIDLLSYRNGVAFRLRIPKRHEETTP